MDITSIFGLILSFVAILGGQVLEGGRIASIIQPTAALIVLGGSIGAVMLSFPLPDFLRGLGMIPKVFFDTKSNAEEIKDFLVEVSSVARRDGVLALENRLNDTPDPLIGKALRHVVDGLEPVFIKNLLEAEISVNEGKEEAALKIFESAGGYAPTMGILGAVLGLIHTMEQLSDPSKIGEGIAVAFVATVYGVGSANIIFLPIANKLKRKLRLRGIIQEMIMEGVLAIQEGINPRIVEERLKVYLEKKTQAEKAAA